MAFAGDQKQSLHHVIKIVKLSKPGEWLRDRPAPRGGVRTKSASIAAYVAVLEYWGSASSGSKHQHVYALMAGGVTAEQSCGKIK